MSLLARVAFLRSSATAADDLVMLKSRTGQIRTCSERVDTLVTDIPALVTALAELSRIGISLDGATSQDAADTVTSLQSLVRTVAGLAVIDPLDAVRSQIKAAENLAKKLTLFVQDQWTPFRDRDLPAINEELLEALASGGVDVEAVRNKLISAQSVIGTLSHRTIPQQGDVERFNRAIEVMRACGEEISTLVDPGIAEGILKSQTGGISLTWFTPDRVTALNELGILDRFTVHLS